MKHPIGWHLSFIDVSSLALIAAALPNQTFVLTNVTVGVVLLGQYLAPSDLSHMLMSAEAAVKADRETPARSRE